MSAPAQWADGSGGPETDAPFIAESLGRRYSRMRPWAVREVSFAVPARTITALVGPNGGGKSTLMRAAIGFERPDAGRVLVCGVDPAHDRVAAVTAIGYVPQATALYRGLTIGDHLAMGSAARSTFDRGYAAHRIRRAGMSEDRVIGQLSGGERAQVSLALALGTRAPLLLLDEPLANLDPLARRDFLTTVVDDIRDRGATAILSSHIVTDIEQACDWLLILAAGRVALHTSVAEAQRRYRTVKMNEPNRADSIGVFAGPAGENLALVDGGDGRASSLEEIVLGHLAAARTAAMGPE